MSTATAAFESADGRTEPNERQLIETGRLAAIGALAGSVAHEINNPLFAILGFVDFLLLDAEQGTKSHERLELIQGSALEIKELVRALLEYVRDRSDERTVLSLTELTAQTVELMRRTNAAKHVELAERYTDADVRIEAIPNQLKQVLVNLISNAKLAFGDDEGTIEVEVGSDVAGAWAWVEVRHTGRDSDATALWFHTSVLIAEAHGGSLTADRTTFRLRLPLAESTATPLKEAVP